MVLVKWGYRKRKVIRGGMHTVAGWEWQESSLRMARPERIPITTEEEVQYRVDVSHGGVRGIFGMSKSQGVSKKHSANIPDGTRGHHHQ